jgi:hypothetical protein
VHASIRAIKVGVPGGIAGRILVGHQLGGGTHGSGGLAGSRRVKDCIAGPVLGGRGAGVFLSLNIGLDFEISGGLDGLLEEGVVVEAPIDVLEHGVVLDLLRIDLIPQFNEVGMVPVLTILITAVDPGAVLGWSRGILSLDMILVLLID